MKLIYRTYLYLYIRCMKLKIRGATRCKQRAVHCLSAEQRVAPRKRKLYTYI